jgi:hypothetical protein
LKARRYCKSSPKRVRHCGRRSPTMREN